MIGGTGPALREGVTGAWGALAVVLVVVGCDIDREGSGPVRPVGHGHDGGSWADDGGGGTVDAARPGHDATCERHVLGAVPEDVQVMIVLDRSGSMYTWGDDGGPERTITDRWTPAVAAIESVTSSLQDRIAFGLTLFGTGDECAVGSVRAMPRLGAAETLRGELAGDPLTVTGGGTPTAATLALVRDALGTSTGQTVVLLVTDGEPNCAGGHDPATCRCADPDPEACSYYADSYSCLDDVAAVNAVAALRDAGIPTYVIGYDSGAFADVLDRMAAAGGTGRDRHIPVSDGATLEGALRSLGGSVFPCEYELDRAPGDFRYVRVMVDGATVDHASVRGDGSGWTLEGERRVTLVGGTCSAVQDGGSHVVEVVVECEPVID